MILNWEIFEIFEFAIIFTKIWVKNYKIWGTRKSLIIIIIIIIIFRGVFVLGPFSATLQPIKWPGFVICGCNLTKGPILSKVLSTMCRAQKRNHGNNNDRKKKLTFFTIRSK